MALPRPQNYASRRMKRRPWLFGLLACCGITAQAQAFTHTVTEKDTLASIAERYYGRIQFEKLLVAANDLDVRGGSPIVRGMRLEVPALGHRVVRQGETWDSLAAELLGSPKRSDVLSMANDSSPWLTPEEGAEIIVPFNLRVLPDTNDTLITIAYRFYGDMNRAWVLDRYNLLNGRKLQPGDVVLVPLTELPLTDAGKQAARASAGAACSQAHGETRSTQKKVAAEIPALLADIRSGRYVDAVARGTRFLASAELSEPQLALVHRQLLEAYVALEAPGLATAACAEWLKRSPGATLSPVELSPKILAVCGRAK
jgi:LysM repeat protein